MDLGNLEWVSFGILGILKRILGFRMDFWWFWSGFMKV